ncbi:MAG: signal peptidase I [Bacilli bacterium]
MKKNILTFYICNIIIIALIVLFNNKNYSILLWILLTIFLFFKCGFPKDKNYLKYNTIQIVIISIFSYFLITYSLGLITGFSKNFFDLNIKSIIMNMLYPFTLITCQELIRYIYAKNCVDDIKPYIMLTLVYIFLEIFTQVNGYNFYNFEILFKFICLVVLKSISHEILYSYITYKISFIPTLIMKLTFGLYIYIIPIFPNLGEYLMSLFGILYPALVYVMIYKTIQSYDKSSKYVTSIKKKYLLYPVILFLCIIAVLTSGIGKYQMIAIGSGSMEPIYKRGDAVIFTKIKSLEEVKIGSIIAFTKNNILITHRVVNIEYKNGDYQFITKGDNNKDIDIGTVSGSNVKGIVIHKIPYIGYPTIWINEKLGNI